MTNAGREQFWPKNHNLPDTHLLPGEYAAGTSTGPVEGVEGDAHPAAASTDAPPPSADDIAVWAEVLAEGGAAPRPSHSAACAPVLPITLCSRIDDRHDTAAQPLFHPTGIQTLCNVEVARLLPLFAYKALPHCWA